MKAEYLAGLCEYDYGQDLSRAHYHFCKFGEISSLFQRLRLRSAFPEFPDIENSIKEYSE